MKVSVIIPSYNYGQFVIDSVQSVLSQTMSDLEVILIDDGSTDNTSEVVKTISDSRFNYIRVENGGVSKARNIGIELAKGEYIAFHDADDLWAPEKLELQLGLFEVDSEVDFVFSDLRRFDENGVLEATQFSFVPELREMQKQSYMGGTAFVITSDPFYALGTTAMFATWVPTVLVKKEILNSIRFPEGIKLCEDYIFMMRLYAEAKLAGYIDKPLLEVRRHNNNSYSTAEDMLEPKIMAVKSLQREICDEGYQRCLTEILTGEYINYAYYHCWFGSIVKGLKMFLKLLFRDGSQLKALKYIFMAPFLPILR